MKTFGEVLLNRDMPKYKYLDASHLMAMYAS